MCPLNCSMYANTSHDSITTTKQFSFNKNFIHLRARDSSNHPSDGTDTRTLQLLLSSRSRHITSWMGTANCVRFKRSSFSFNDDAELVCSKKNYNSNRVYHGVSFCFVIVSNFNWGKLGEMQKFLQKSACFSR